MRRQKERRSLLPPFWITLAAMVLDELPLQFESFFVLLTQLRFELCAVMRDFDVADENHDDADE